jgi:hypothetical protein
MIHMPHVHSNISVANLGVINSQFYRFLRLCSCKEFLVSQMVSRILLLKIQGHPLRILLKRSRGLLNKKKWKPTWSLFFSALLFCVLSILLYFSVFCYLLVLLLVSSQWHGSVLLLLPKFQQKLRMQKDFSFHTFQDLHFLWFQHI